MKWEILSKSQVSNIESLISVLLKNRGIKNHQEFFQPTPPEKLELSILGISKLELSKARQRIKKALKTKEKVIVYGDYDADGICGTAILWEALYCLGLNVLPYIPERFSEGYGLNAESIEKLKTLNPKLKLIITVDNGIVAHNGVGVANKLGIDVIITDHHEPGKVKPKAYSIVHSSKISGSAVAWVLARELIHNSKFKIHNSLELAAIGTIADQLPLIGVNRSFAKYGLLELARTKRPGLSALFAEARIDPNTIGTYEINFIIAPRLNAMGRLVHGLDSLRLLCTKDRLRAGELAALIGRTNSQRQKIVEDVVLQAKERLGGKVKENVIILAHEDYHEGVIGLAAAKLVEEFYRPAIVLSKKGEISKASARSISGFNIIEAIRKLEHLYIEGGGHPMAAGFSIETAKIEIFSKEFNKLAKPYLTEEVLTKKLKIDLEIDFDRLNPTSPKLRGAGYDLYEELKKFEPTGIGNPTPVFLTRGVEVLEARPVGREGSHLKLRLRQNSVVFDAIGFGLANRYPLSSNNYIDVVYSLEDNSWNGTKNLQLKIKDLKIIR